MVKVGKINKNFPKQSEKSYDSNKFIAAFAIATLMFIIGIFVGTLFINYKIEKINAMNEAMRFDMASAELQEILNEQESCAPISYFEEKLEEVESKVKYMEDQLGKYDSKVLNLKKDYALIELRHYFIMKERQEKCAGNYSVILFFYSNKPGEILEGEKQGYVLDDLRRRYGLDFLKVYSLDVNLGLDIIDTLREIYGLEQVPSLVINGEAYSGFQSKDRLNEILNLPQITDDSEQENMNISLDNSTSEENDSVIILR